MTSRIRGIILIALAVIVGLIMLLNPLTNVSESVQLFWVFLTYTWFALAVLLSIIYVFTETLKLGPNIPLAVSLLLGGAVSMLTTALARQTENTISMVFSILWLLAFCLIGFIEFRQRSRTNQSF
ncbi:hypothetical protein ACN08Z_03465 [Rothia sp. P7181]|uniref:hypothetical protein n=1 Tax=Rothia sp. P7181 TaxID=3402663 RepID=UPI003AE3431D